MREIAGQTRSGRKRGRRLQKNPPKSQTQKKTRREKPSPPARRCPPPPPLLPPPRPRFPKAKGREGAVLWAFSPRSPLPWAIMLKLTWLVLIQITRTMLTTGYHVDLHKPRKNAVVQIPLTPLQSQIYSRQQTAQKLYESKWC